MPRAAVIGSPIAHSLSPDIHNAGYVARGLDEWSYHRFEVNADSFSSFLAGIEENHPDIVGLSVTMPCKFAALQAANVLSEKARIIGSANTLVRTPSGWSAENTDCDGVLGALNELELSESPQHVVLIGAGGTARPALWALGEIGTKQVSVINRSDRSQELKELIHATGMSVEFYDFAVDVAALVSSADAVVSTVPSAAVEDIVPQLAHTKVCDVIYDPWPTPLTAAAASNGYATVGGHVMLLKQALRQFELFTGAEAPEDAMRKALYRALSLKSI